jgi:hypothetical protein
MGLSAWRRTRLRERVLLWLLPTLVFRALIPAGFMPASDHGLALELCSSVGYGVVFEDYEPAASPEGHSGSDVTHHDPCAFAASATPTPVPVVSTPTAADSSSELPARVLSAAVLPEPSALRPPPRAPPRSV